MTTTGTRGSTGDPRASLLLAVSFHLVEPEQARVPDGVTAQDHLHALEAQGPPDAWDALARLRRRVWPSTSRTATETLPVPPLAAISLEVLDPAASRPLLAASFVRLARREGLVSPDDGDDPDQLLERGLLDPQTTMDLYQRVQEPRAACMACFALRETLGGTCEHCGTTHQEIGWSTGGAADGGFPVDGGLFGDYEVIERAAEGGMGVVFRARDLQLGRTVALKVMRGGLLATELRKRRFLQEAEAAANLQHPHIVPIHRIGEHNGYPFYTMDFVEGADLDRYVRDQDAPPTRSAQLVATVADAVHHFHLRGIIHRDLKPDNVLVSHEGLPYIIDFGIAKSLNETESSRSWTAEGDVLGTPHYMPPEQAAGQTLHVDARSDVYALGAILYQLLCGEPPFAEHARARLLHAIQYDDPTPLRTQRPDTPRDLCAIVDKAMAKERERRYQSATELSQDLQRFLDNEPILARPATLGYRLRKFARRNPTVVASAAVTLAAALALAGYLSAQRLERLAQIRQLIDRAADSPLDQRAEHLQAALALDPNHTLATNRLMETRLAQERAEAARILREQERLAQESERALAAERELAEARAAEAEAREAQRLEAERATAEAQAQARRDLEARVAQLHQSALASDDLLARISQVNDALALLPPDPSPLRDAVERTKVETALALGQRAIDDQLAGLARFWLREARTLTASERFAEPLAAADAALERLASGRLLLESAQAAVTRLDWRGARLDLQRARQAGVATQDLLDLEAVVDARLVAQGRAAQRRAADQLLQGQFDQAWASIQDARTDLPGDPEVDALAARVRDALAARAHLTAWQLWPRPESRPQALALLGDAARQLQDTPQGDVLEAERAARARLLDDPRLLGLTFVSAPELPDAPPPFLIGLREVTHLEFQAFVDAGGYDHPEWFPNVDPDSLRDASLGEVTHRGPRIWRDGTYGDPARADQPVRGITYAEAHAYAAWLREKTGLPWRLPTAREWELAAGWDPSLQRLRLYPWGDDFAQGQLPFRANQPAPVGRSQPDRSPWGLLDAGGNVAEWVTTPDGTPGLKGTHFACDAALARQLALVRVTGTPGATPPRALQVVCGLRLVLPAQEGP